MENNYSFEINEAAFHQLVKDENWAAAFELLAAPLHEWLYQEQSFEKLASKTPYEQLVLCFDYVQMQVGQGGFIQLIQNGYISLLVLVIENLQALNLAPDMAKVLDDGLKVYVLNHELLERETSVEAFGKLYEEFKEFEVLEEIYNIQLQACLKSILHNYLK